MNLKPIGNRVLAQRIEEETTKGTLIVVDSGKKKNDRAKIIAVGDLEKSSTRIQLSVGDTIIMEKYAGQEVTIEDIEYLIVSVENILAVIGK